MILRTPSQPAPDFTLPDEQGQMLRFSDLYRQKNLLLVFNIGFV